MRIVYFGDGPWAHKALQQVLDAGHEVELIVVRNDFRDEVLIRMAEENGIEATWYEDVNSAEFLDKLRALNVDLLVSMSFNQIIQKELLELTPGGVINCHAGKLPDYRGRNILNWALINDEKEIGVTCHYVDEGVDTGDIILQKTFPLTDSDDYQTVLYRAYDLCAEVLTEAMGIIERGAVQRRKQPRFGTYYSARREGDEYINWEWSSRRVFNFVRAITTPGPLARTWLQWQGGYKPLWIKKAVEVADAVAYHCVPGAVVGISEAGNPLVKTGDTLVELQEYEIRDTKTKKKLRIGDRLGANQDLLFQQWVKQQIKE